MQNSVTKQMDFEFNGKKLSVIKHNDDVYIPLNQIIEVSGRYSIRKSMLTNVSVKTVPYRGQSNSRRIAAAKLNDTQILLDEIERRALTRIEEAETARRELVPFIKGQLASAEKEDDTQPRTTTVREHQRKVPGKRLAKPAEVEEVKHLPLERKIQLAGLILREAGFTGMELAHMLDGLVVHETKESVIQQCAASV